MRWFRRGFCAECHRLEQENTELKRNMERLEFLLSGHVTLERDVNRAFERLKGYYRLAPKPDPEKMN